MGNGKERLTNMIMNAIRIQPAILSSTGFVIRPEDSC
jgi:hypothetical protein